MRGDKIIGGAGAQSATVFAGRVGPQTFRLRNRWTHALTVARIETSDAGYVDQVAGDLQPRVWAGQRITVIRATSGDLLVINSVGDPFVGVNTLRLMIEGLPPIVMTFDVPQDRYEATVPGIRTWLSDRIGQVLGLRFGKVD